MDTSAGQLWHTATLYVGLWLCFYKVGAALPSEMLMDGGARCRTLCSAAIPERTRIPWNHRNTCLHAGSYGIWQTILFLWSRETKNRNWNGNLIICPVPSQQCVTHRNKGPLLKTPSWVTPCRFVSLGMLKMFDIPIGARHIVIEENETSPHIIGEFILNRSPFMKNNTHLLFFFHFPYFKLQPPAAPLQPCAG